MINCLFTGDDASNQARPPRLFEPMELGEHSVAAPATVIAEAAQHGAVSTVYSWYTDFARIAGITRQGP